MEEDLCVYKRAVHDSETKASNSEKLSAKLKLELKGQGKEKRGLQQEVCELKCRMQRIESGELYEKRAFEKLPTFMQDVFDECEVSPFVFPISFPSIN